MFVHAVYFYLRPDLTEAERAALAEGLASLRAADSVQNVHIGTPVPATRPVVDDSYGFSLIITFADQAGHDAYQVHPVHLAFVEKCASYWTQVKIYDSVG